MILSLFVFLRVRAGGRSGASARWKRVAESICSTEFGEKATAFADSFARPRPTDYWVMRLFRSTVRRLSVQSLQLAP